LIGNDERRKREPFLLMLASNPAESSESVLGPAKVFRAVGASLRLGPATQEVAYFRDGRWRVQNVRRHFSLLWTEASTIVQLENPSTGESLELGTFEMVGILCDTMYGGREHSQPIASLDERSGQWRSCADGSLWPEMVLLPSPRVPFPWDRLSRAQKEMAVT
jgi:hypothetical protein